VREDDGNVDVGAIGFDVDGGGGGDGIGVVVLEDKQELTEGRVGVWGASSLVDAAGVPTCGRRHLEQRSSSLKNLHSTTHAQPLPDWATSHQSPAELALKRQVRLRAEKEKLDARRAQEQKQREDALLQQSEVNLHKSSYSNQMNRSVTQECRAPSHTSDTGADRREQLRQRLKRRQTDQSRKKKEEGRLMRELEEAMSCRPESPLEGWGGWGGSAEETEEAMGGWWQENSV
jgi:hypothetical protein